MHELCLKNSVMSLKILKTRNELCVFLIYTKSYNKNRKQNRRSEEKSCPLPTKPALAVKVCFTHAIEKLATLIYCIWQLINQEYTLHI